MGEGQGGRLGNFAWLVMSGQLVSLVKILTLCWKVCFKTFGENLDANFPWGSITRAEKALCLCEVW